MKTKDSVVAKLTKGIEYLFKKNRVEWLRGTAEIHPGNKIVVSDKSAGCESHIVAQHTIVATGSFSSKIPGVEIGNFTSLN